MRRWFRNKWVRMGLVVVVIGGVFFGGAALGGRSGGPVATPAPVPTVAPPLPPSQAPINVTVNQTVNNPPSVNVTVNQTVNGNQSSSQFAAPSMVTGDFRVSVHRADGWFIDSFKESVIDTTSGPVSRTGNVLVTWKGNFSVPVAGRYQFSSDSGADLYIDDGPRVIAPVYLTSGVHRLTFGPCLKSAGEIIRLYWQKVG